MIDRILLFPYTITLALRDRLYREGKLKSVSAEVPTISVGNITVGGTGKTPHTEMILRLLLDSDRWGYSNIAVLSRGYKRKTKGFRKVLRDGTAANFGDEPLQIAKKFPSVTVAVDKDRVEGCRLLVHPAGVAELPPSDVIILDDAFQYRKLRPTLSIVLVDYSRPIHKDRLLPFGGLRDLPSRIADADIVIVTKCPSYLDEWERGKWADYLGISSYSTASCRGRSARGREQLLLFSTIAYSGMEPVYETADSRFTYSPRAILFSGIAKDEPLRDYISDKYKIVRRFSFPDHHRYSRADVAAIMAAVKSNPTAVVITTEKDAQRIVDAKDVPDSLRERLFKIPIEVEFLSEEEKKAFSEALLGSIG